MRASQLSKIVLALQAELAEACDLPLHLVNVSTRRQVENLSGDRDILIRVRAFQNDPAHASRHDCRTRRTIDIVLRTRLALDKAGNDLQWLTKESLGILDFEQTVIDAVQLWEPTETLSGAVANLMVQPARILSGSDPTRDIPSADNKTWGETVLSVEVVYGQNLDRTEI